MGGGRQGCATGSCDVSEHHAGIGHMINAASPDLSSKTCGSVRAHATDRRWKTSFDFHRRPGNGGGCEGALLRDCHQNSWVIFKWPNSQINPLRLAWLNVCLCAPKRMGSEEKSGGKTKRARKVWSSNEVLWEKTKHPAGYATVAHNPHL